MRSGRIFPFVHRKISAQVKWCILAKFTCNPFGLHRHLILIIVMPWDNQGRYFQMFPLLRDLSETVLNRLNISTCEFPVEVVVERLKVNVKGIGK